MQQAQAIRRNAGRYLALTLVLLLTVVPGVGRAEEPGDEVVGRWSTVSSLLNIYRDGQLGLVAEIIALQDAVYQAGEANGPVGAPRRDDNNPDAQRQQRPLLGLNLLSDYQFDGKKWQGQIYDPESGKTYSSNMRVAKDGTLKMRGYVGVPMFGRTAEFHPVDRCDEATVSLLRAAQLPGCE